MIMVGKIKGIFISFSSNIHPYIQFASGAPGLVPLIPPLLRPKCCNRKKKLQLLHDAGVNEPTSCLCGHHYGGGSGLAARWTAAASFTCAPTCFLGLITISLCEAGEWKKWGPGTAAISLLLGLSPCCKDLAPLLSYTVALPGLSVPAFYFKKKKKSF